MLGADCHESERARRRLERRREEMALGSGKRMCGFGVLSCLVHMMDVPTWAYVRI